MSAQIVEGLRTLIEEQKKTNEYLGRLVPMMEVQTRLLTDQAQLTLEMVMSPELRPFDQWPEQEDGACNGCGGTKVKAPPEPVNETHEARVCAGCGNAWKVPRLLTCGGCGSKHPATDLCACGHTVPAA